MEGSQRYSVKINTEDFLIPFDENILLLKTAYI